jgi:uncharacterized membrane protein YphA (DoxX/SURF4 family)/thiol-disulfide isomerase/thioredoxin
MVLAIRVALATVFAYAAWQKWRDRAATSEAVTAFGVPRRFTASVVLGLPAVELLIAALLLIDPVAMLGGAAAAAVLAIFTAATIRLLLRGETPNCNCFGATASTPIGWYTVARNAVFAAAAALIIAGAPGDPTASAWLDDVRDGRASTSVVLVGIGALGLLVLWAMRRVLAQIDDLSRQVAVLSRAVEGGVVTNPAASTPHAGSVPIEPGLPIGAPAPGFLLADPQGTMVSLAALLEPGLPLVVVFASGSCVPCAALLPQIADWEAAHRNRVRLVVIASGDRSDGAPHGYRGDLLLFDTSSSTGPLYRASWTPAAVHISADGRVASGVGYGEAGVAEVVMGAIARDATRVEPSAKVAVGDGVPDELLAAARAAGIDLTNGSYELVAWTASCSYCSELAQQLRLRSDAEQLELLMLSADDATSVTAATDRRSIADPGGELATALGISGTPSGVLIDDGRFTSPLGLGVDDVLALAGVYERAPTAVPVDLGPHPEG